LCIGTVPPFGRLPPTWWGASEPRLPEHSVELRRWLCEVLEILETLAILEILEMLAIPGRFLRRGVGHSSLSKQRIRRASEL
jgi:hypothetical protein